MSQEDRSTRGAEILARLHADYGAPNVLGPLEQIAPDLKNMVRDFAFGEIYARPGLDLKYRQLVTITALAARDNTGTEFKAHLRGALKLGWTKEELVEALMQLAVYAGFPSAIHSLLVAKEVFDDAGKATT